MKIILKNLWLHGEKMKKIVEYKIECLSTIEEETFNWINGDFQEGWQPYGAPIIDKDKERLDDGEEIVLFWQAMVKYEE